MTTKKWIILSSTVGAIIALAILVANGGEGEGSPKHIIGRTLLHAICAPGTVLITSNLWRIAARRLRTVKGMPRTMEQTLAYGVFSAVPFAWAREAFDVARGQPLFKAPIDYASHAIFMAIGAWLLYRWGYFGWDKAHEDPTR